MKYLIIAAIGAVVVVFAWWLGGRREKREGPEVSHKVVAACAVIGTMLFWAAIGQIYLIIFLGPLGVVAMILSIGFFSHPSDDASEETKRFYGYAFIASFTALATTVLMVFMWIGYASISDKIAAVCKYKLVLEVETLDGVLVGESEIAVRKDESLIDGKEIVLFKAEGKSPSIPVAAGFKLSILSNNEERGLLPIHIQEVLKQDNPAFDIVTAGRIQLPKQLMPPLFVTRGIRPDSLFAVDELGIFDGTPRYKVWFELIEGNLDKYKP